MQPIYLRDEYKAFLESVRTGDDTVLVAFLDWLREQGNPAADDLEKSLMKLQGRGKSRAIRPVQPNSVSFVRATWQDRHDRATHPEGHFDGGGRWYPSEREDCGGSGSDARGPSRSWPYSYLLRCRSRDHVRALVLTALGGGDVPPDVVHTAGQWRAWVIRRYFDTVRNLGNHATPEPTPETVTA